MARLNPSRPAPSRTKKTIFSSSESESNDNSNSGSDSELADIVPQPQSPNKKRGAPATRKRASPPTESVSIESATSPNAASSTIIGGVNKRRKLLLGATFSDNVLFQKWTPNEEDKVPARKKKRVLTTAASNNPFAHRSPLKMMRDDGEEESDSEVEKPVVRGRKKKVEGKEVKEAKEENRTVTAKAVEKTTEESLFSDRVVSKEPKKSKGGKEVKDTEEDQPASLFRPPKQIPNQDEDMMEIDKEDEMDIFEDLEDFAEESFHTACSLESSEPSESDGPTVKTNTAGKRQNASTTVPNSKDDDSDEDLDDFFTRLSSKPKIPLVRESHLSPTKPRATKNTRMREMDKSWEGPSGPLFDEEDTDEERRQARAKARATKQTVVTSDEDEDEDEDTCGEEDVTQDFSCLQLESSSSRSSDSDDEGSETETEQRQSRPPPATTTAARKRTRTPSPSPPPKLIPKLKPMTKEEATTLPPPSPKKLPRIPTTPHRPSSDLFWSREFVDDWNDEHSPVKKELFPSDKESSTKPPPADSPKKKGPRARDPSPQKLATLQARESRLARLAFDTHKYSLATAFLSLLDARLTSGRLSQLTASTGGIKLIWSKTLNTTAGRANWKKESITTRLCKQQKQQKQQKDEKGEENEKKEVKHHASIELATKVLSTPERLFNTLAHEFCHLAVFMIDGVTVRPHGAEFKAWAKKVNESEFGRGRGSGSAPFGSLVVGEEDGSGSAKWEGGYAVEVTTRHGYEIEFRYVWVCDGPPPPASGSASGLSWEERRKKIDEAKAKKKGDGKEKGEDGKGCGTEYKRHSKSVDPSRHRCGVCKGVLRQVKPAPRGQGQQQPPSSTSDGVNREENGSQEGGGGGMGTNKVKAQPKTSEYQIFVKEQMKVVKAQKPGLAFGEVMKEVAERWKVEKAKRERERGLKKATPPATEVVVGKKLSTSTSTLLEDVIADEADSPGSLEEDEDEPMMDVVDLTADD